MKTRAGSVAVLHDYVNQRGGAERVALHLAHRVGNHKLNTTVYLPERTFPGFADLDVEEIFGWLPKIVKKSRLLLVPVLIICLPLKRMDSPVLLCSSSGWAHWVRCTGIKVVYCYSPPRWLYEPEHYVSRRIPGVGRAVRYAMKVLRAVDRARARSAVEYVAISSVVQNKIVSSYGIKASLLPPPVTFDREGPAEEISGLPEEYFLTVARPRGYKNTEEVVAAFAGGDLGAVVVVGGGRPAGDSGAVRHVGMVSDAQLRWLYQNCKATIALSHEDFGLTPVEGHLFGKPSIVLRGGGYLDTCLPGINGVFVDGAEAPSLRRAMAVFESSIFDPAVVAASAERYLPRAFDAALQEILTGCYEKAAIRGCDEAR